MGGGAGAESTCNAGTSGDEDSILESESSPGGGHGNMLQYSCLENPMGREPSGLQSIASQRVRHRSDLACVHFSYSRQQQRTISRLDCDVWWKVDFIWQPVTTSSVIRLRSSKALPKLAPKKGRGRLVICCLSAPLQLSESQPNNYIWEVRSANQWDAPKPATPAQ